MQKQSGNATVTPDAQDAASWLLSRGGQQYGPFAPSLVTMWANTGQLATDVKLSNNGGPWITLAEFLAQATPSGEPSVGLAGEEDDAGLQLADEKPARPVAGKLAEPAEDPLSLELPPPLPLPSQPEAMPAAAPLEEESQRTHLGMVVATPDDAEPTRDRIVILGRRQSGKTVYMASLYAMLWRSLDTITAKALSGTGHAELMSIVETLRAGQWPHATQAMMQIELEVEYKSRRRLMVTLDFAGELFAKAFLLDQGNAPEVKPLLHHIDHAAAVMLLVDPAVAVGQDHQAAMEDDFGLVQAVQRIRNWPGGDAVPIVFVLTKADLHQHILDRFGGPVGFVRAHFPALVRLMKQVPIFQVSAVQSRQNPDGSMQPKADSVHINVEKPLHYCLETIDRNETAEYARREKREQEAILERFEQQEAVKEKRQVRWLTVAVISIFVLGAAAVGAIVYYRF